MPLSRQAAKAEVESPVAILFVHLLGYGENRTVDVLLTRAAYKSIDKPRWDHQTGPVV